MQGCQFAVALDNWAISEMLVLLCGFPNYLCEVSLIVGDSLLVAVGMLWSVVRTIHFAVKRP
jgi:hypothetical protein